MGKADFLGNWLQEYVNYQYMGMDMDKLNEMLPPCYKMSDYRGLCRNGDRKLECFTTPVQNCPMCYCTDHAYSDLSGLTQYWRQDYRMWREFFSQYRRQYEAQWEAAMEAITAMFKLVVIIQLRSLSFIFAFFKAFLFKCICKLFFFSLEDLFC